MKRILTALLALVMITALVACGGDSKESADSDMKVGIILIGDENEGYTYAHMEGILNAVKELGIGEENLVYKFSIPEDESAYDAAVDLAEQGCKVIFANSFGHESYIKQAAAEYPDIFFCHATGTAARTAGLSNFCNYFDNIYESRYVSGIVAGMKLQELLDNGEVTDPYVGYVGAYPYAEVVSGYTAFFLGIRSIVPDAHMDVIYTNSWFDITAEGAAADALMARGAVIVGQHADSTGAPSAVQAKHDGGAVVYSVGYNIDMLSVAPTAALTSAQNNWVVMYKEILEDILNDGKIESDYSAGYAEDAVKISALGESCAAGSKEAVDAAVAAIKAGTLNVFDTSTFTVGGQEVTAAFATDTDGDFVNDADEAVFDGYYHESFFMSAPSFSLRIDGITELSE
ncbi:MAG: BMP family ABC transporter substrate-binding protein [Oscillospiraceae bacterium]|jgi:basic membrane protein A|nr:BMP family ABC transporter substrate-binding protein [Oscillospiraceae bacterium]